MLSLGLGFELTNLFEDCRDGLLLCAVADALQPGLVDRSRLALEPRSIYEKVASRALCAALYPFLLHAVHLRSTLYIYEQVGNCNAAVVAARSLGLHVVRTVQITL